MWNVWCGVILTAIKALFIKVYQLLQHIERSWEIVSSDAAGLSVFEPREGDRANNAAERLIGLDYKIRAKTMRGAKNINKPFYARHSGPVLAIATTGGLPAEHSGQAGLRDGGVLGHCYLSELLRGDNGVCDLRKVV